MRADADNFQLTLWIYIGNNRSNFVRADIERNDSLHMFFRSHVYDPLCFGESDEAPASWS